MTMILKSTNKRKLLKDLRPHLMNGPVHLPGVAIDVQT